MFSDHATIGVAASATALPSITSEIATTLQGSAITPQKSAMAQQGSSISPRTWSHAKLSWMETGVTLFMKEKFQRGQRPKSLSTTVYHTETKQWSGHKGFQARPRILLQCILQTGWDSRYRTPRPGFDGLSPHPETEASGNHKKWDRENP